MALTPQQRSARPSGYLLVVIFEHPYLCCLVLEAFIVTKDRLCNSRCLLVEAPLREFLWTMYCAMDTKLSTDSESCCFVQTGLCFPPSICTRPQRTLGQRYNWIEVDCTWNPSMPQECPHQKLIQMSPNLNLSLYFREKIKGEKIQSFPAMRMPS